MIRDAAEIDKEKRDGLTQVGGLIEASKSAIVLTLDHRGMAAVACFPGGANLHVLLGLLEFGKLRITHGDPLDG